MEGKRTIVFFVLILVIGVANLFGFGSFELPPELGQWVAPVLAIAGLVLRSITKGPVDFSKK